MFGNILISSYSGVKDSRQNCFAKSKMSAVPQSEYAGYPHYAFVQDFETGLTPEFVVQWFENNWHYSLYISVAYLTLIFSLREYMKNRRPVKVRRAVIVWDASVAVFSICGMLRAAPELYHVLKNYGIEHSVCDSRVNSVSLFWGLAFVLSKAVELLDTIFIVLKKQKLTTLHVSHHVLTLVILFYYGQEMPAGVRYVITLNYSVHSFMYSYFALKAARFNIPLNISMIMTSVQILQFVVGLPLAVFVLRAHFQGRPCTSKIQETVVGLIFFLYLIYMFVKFFLQRYNITKSAKHNVD